MDKNNYISRMISIERLHTIHSVTEIDMIKKTNTSYEKLIKFTMVVVKNLRGRGLAHQVLHCLYHTVFQYR